MRPLWAIGALSLACGGPASRSPDELGSRTAPAGPSSAAVERSAPDGWLKGQLHLHSNASGDSDTPPEDVVRWYAARDYDFIVFTDHNRVTEQTSTGAMLVLPGVELTQNLTECDPPPEAGMQCLLHVNALLVDPQRSAAASAVAQPRGISRRDRYVHGMRVSQAMGGIAQLNHPNFHLAATQDDLLWLTQQGLALFEVANEAWDSNNDGGHGHPSTEQMWDSVLSRGGRLYGTATDDAHHYFDAQRRKAAGEDVFTGDRGFVMIRADKSDASIRAALSRGDFYASTGVILREVTFNAGVFEVRVAESTAAPFEVRFIANGSTVARSTNSVARFDTTGGRYTYVRATVRDAHGRRAWAQPVFLPG